MTRYTTLDTDGVSAEDFYLSPITPDQTKEYASLMYDEGASDTEIGKMVMHHIHDLTKPDGLRVFEVHARESEDVHGIVVFVPNADAYDLLNREYSTDVGKWFDASIRMYGLPNGPLSKDIVRREIVKRGLDPSRVVATNEHVGDDVLSTLQENSTNVYTFE